MCSLYAVLSLTVVRMLPVALALLGAGFDRYERRVHRLVRAAGAGLGHLRPARPDQGLEHHKVRRMVAIISLTVLVSAMADWVSGPGSVASRQPRRRTRSGSASPRGEARSQRGTAARLVVLRARGLPKCRPPVGVQEGVRDDVITTRRRQRPAREEQDLPEDQGDDRDVHRIPTNR